MWNELGLVCVCRGSGPGEVLLQHKGGQVPEREPVEPGYRLRVLEGDWDRPADRGLEAEPGQEPAHGDEEDAGLLQREAPSWNQDRLDHARVPARLTRPRLPAPDELEPGS